MGGRLAAATSAVVAAAAADRGSVVDVAPRVAACLRAFRRGCAALVAGRAGEDAVTARLFPSPARPPRPLRARVCVRACWRVRAVHSTARGPDRSARAARTGGGQLREESGGSGREVGGGGFWEGGMHERDAPAAVC